MIFKITHFKCIIHKNNLKKQLECTADEYRCNSGKCIPELALCDNAKDCPQGDDEQDCECARNEVSKA